MDTLSASIRHVPQQTTIGADFARAFVEKDAERVRELLHPEVEQQAYLSTRDGQIDWIRVVCSGLRPAPER
jgi:hypothetical protein